MESDELVANILNEPEVVFEVVLVVLAEEEIFPGNLIPATVKSVVVRVN